MVTYITKVSDTNQQNKVIQIVTLIDGMPYKPYLEEALPDKKDEVLSRTIEEYASLTAEYRSAMYTLIDQKASDTLWAFAYRMSMQSVRIHSSKLVIQAFIALMLALASSDDRDILMTLSIVHSSAVSLGEVTEIYAKALALAPNPIAANLLLGFQRRMPEDQHIEVMGFHKLEGPHGLIYKFGSTDIPDGWL